MENKIQYATVLQKNLDKVMVQQSVTGWMEANAGQVKYEGGNEIKIPKISTSGLGNYKRGSSKAFPGGAISTTYETFKMTQDRGRQFTWDAMDVDESNFVVTAANVMTTTQKESIAPEVDAYRLSNLSQIAIKNNNVEYGFIPGNTKVKSIDKVKDAITKIRENGFEGDLVIHCTYDFKNQIEKEMIGSISPVKFLVDGVETEVFAIDGCPLIPTVSNRMVTKIDLLDGESEGQEEGGFKKSKDALSINFMVIAKVSPLAVCKTDKIRIFEPAVNQDADAWKLDFRKYHDIWVMDNKVNGIFVNIKDTKPVTVDSQA
ncbi:MAG: hypothetical protein E6038_00145 [Clostridium perfringens]|uniref:hypothetical protein n=1 Tax=Clostridium perfringens TaxID=1502 RepID=UPI0013E3DDD8|nr:hypothetical protein [Clostridium perfringens]MDM0961659.1 hypothetical protein [Clostridium perfringens]MDU5649527.1 hypothetical protein [Clostridium perfringens]NGU13978.1 hypothetical protein [Clostridium perfringens]NGU48083.1 hypothetical protein [Clostridium perfringens]